MTSGMRPRDEVLARRRERTARRITWAYALLAALWILLSDGLLVLLVQDRTLLGKLAVVKGWLFVAVTSLLLYVALRRQLRRWDDEVAARRRWVDAFAHCSHGLAIGKPATNTIGACNSAFVRMLGREPEEMIGTPILSLYAPAEREHVRAHIAAADRLGHTRYEAWMLKKDGTTLRVQMDLVSVADDRETIQYRVATIQDITERKQAEAALQYQEDLLRETGRIAKVGGWDFDPATGTGRWTEEVARIHELDPAVEPSLEIGLGFYHGDSRARIDAAVQAAIERGTPYDLELELTTAAGNRKWVRTIGHATFENGKCVRLHGSFQDITAHKRTELALAEETLRRRILFEQSEGCIEVESAPGQGTCIRIYLPAVEAQPADAGERVRAALGHGSETVLLVEDEEGVRNIVELTLERHGYRVLAARDGRQALSVAVRHQGPIHLLVTDVVMPLTGGPQLAEQLRADNPDLRVLFMSGYIDDAVVRHGIHATGAAFLQKPFSPLALADKVRAILDAPPGAA